MKHGFSRFGPLSPREQLHQRMRGPGTLAMLLPTIFATLFLFTIVVTLNKASSLTRGGKLVRIINVDDVFPAESVDQHKKKQYFEAPPPPSPEAVLAAGSGVEPPILLEAPPGISQTLSTGWDSGSLNPKLLGFDRSTVEPETGIAQRPAASRPLMIPVRELEFPDVAPNTELTPQPTP